MPAETSPAPVIENSHQRKRTAVPIAAAVVFLCVLASVFYWVGSASPLDQARKAAAAGEVYSACHAFEEHLRTHPQDWKAQLEYGAFLKQHDAATAITVLREIPKSSEQFVPAARHIAHIALVGKNDALAESALTRIIAQNPNDFETIQQLALLYRRQGKFKEALPFAVKSAELKPQILENQLLLAQVYFGLGRSSEMADPLLKALKIDPENREAHLNLAFSYVMNPNLESNLEKARNEVEWSRQRDPGNVQVWRMLSMIEWSETNDEKALQYARKGLEIDPNEIECRILEGQILVFQKKFQEAYDRMIPMYERHPSEQRVLGVLVQATRALGRKAEGDKFQKLQNDLLNENYRVDKKSGTASP